MNAHESRRRGLVAASVSVGLASLGPSRTLAQAQDSVSFAAVAPSNAGSEHRASLSAATAALAGKSPLSLDGLTNVVNYLVARKVLTRDDGLMLNKLVQTIFAAKTVDAMLTSVDSLLSDFKNRASDAALALLNIARDSVSYVQTALKGVPFQKALQVVSSDISGGLEGAATAERLKANPRGIVVAIVIGAAAASINAALEK